MFQKSRSRKYWNYRNSVLTAKMNIYLSIKGKNYYYTSFRYYMKDGSVFERRYPVSVTEKALKDKNSVAFKLTALETDPDNMMKQVLGNGYKENDYYSGYLTVYKEDGESDVYTFSRQESAVLAGRC